MKKTEPGAKASRRAAAIAVGALVVGVLAGPKILPAGGSAEGSATTTTLFELGPVLTLPPITLNLADGRVLRVGLALQFPYDPEPKGSEAAEGEASEGEDESADPTLGHAVDLDAAINVLGGRTMEQLLAGPGREEARLELTQRVAEHDGEEPGLEGLYFYEFVMQ